MITQPVIFWQLRGNLIKHGNQLIAQGRDQIGEDVVLDNIPPCGMTQVLVRFALAELNPTGRRWIRLPLLAAHPLVGGGAWLVAYDATSGHAGTASVMLVVALTLVLVFSFIILIERTILDTVSQRDRFKIRTLNGHLPPESFIWLTTNREGRGAIVELRAILKLEEEEAGIDAKIAALGGAITSLERQAAEHAYTNRELPELADVNTPLDNAAAIQRLHKQQEALMEERGQFAPRLRELLRAAQVCAVLMERLRVAGLGGSWLELPNEDPLPFMQRFIVDGKAKLKAKYEVDGVAEASV